MPLQGYRQLGLHNKLAIITVLLVAVPTLFLAAFSISFLEQEHEVALGEKALAVSQSLAKNPLLVAGLEQKNSHVIQHFVEPLRRLIGASFIVVGDRQSVRYSHPDSTKIKQKMIGGDNLRALHFGESYVSRAKGSLGVSIRGKSPIYSEQGEIIGVVSVGYLESTMLLSIDRLRNTFGYVFGIVLLIAGVLALYVSKRYRDEIFGLEPEEIARIYSERKAVLESIVEGIVVIDNSGTVTSGNRKAKELLQSINHGSIINQKITQLFPSYAYLFETNSLTTWQDLEVMIDETTFIMTKSPLVIKHQQQGVVLSFRAKEEIEVLSQKLSQVEHFSNMLQVQTHEYSNKLNTIAGLIQIGSYDEALDLITVESSGYQDLIGFIMRAVSDAVIAALILGKYDVAKERNLELIIDKESSLNQLPEWIEPIKLVTILGNVLENAFDASVANPNGSAKVFLSMTDVGQDLIFEIEDAGIGMSEKEIGRVFELGYTNKGEQGHGIGLYLVKSCLEQLQGSISITRAKHGGTIMTIYVPKMKS